MYVFESSKDLIQKISAVFFRQLVIRADYLVEIDVHELGADVNIVE